MLLVFVLYIKKDIHPKILIEKEMTGNFQYVCPYVYSIDEQIKMYGVL